MPETQGVMFVLETYTPWQLVCVPCAVAIKRKVYFMGLAINCYVLYTLECGKGEIREASDTYAQTKHGYFIGKISKDFTTKRA